jgi:exosortase family protein XrtF
MSQFSFKEFKPTVLFLTKFLGLYLIANLLYGLYVTYYRPHPDPVTHTVSSQTGIIVSTFGWSVSIMDNPTRPTTHMIYNNRTVLEVYEGCNGVNTMIVFISFVFAFGPLNRKMLWFIPLGIVSIHVFNLLRVTLLFFVAEYRPNYMYFFHKYIFTAMLYVAVFLFWIWWVRLFKVSKGG